MENAIYPQRFFTYKEYTYQFILDKELITDCHCGRSVAKTRNPMI
jgi:hypothetical protein